LSAEDIRALLIGRLSKFKIPSVIEFATSLPRQDNGKIYKRSLAEPYWQGHGRRI
jgi:long-chain acyl-CoA synthetase